MKLIPAADIHAKHMRNPAYRKAYNDLELEFELINALIKARAKRGMTQTQLAKKMGTKQSAIARFEAGKTNPTLAFIQRLSDVLGLELKLRVRH